MAAISENLKKGQAAVPVVEPAEFAPMLEKGKDRVMARAREAGVKMPDRFGLGFNRYAAGELPSTDAIPRLVTQLQAAEGIINILFDARVNEIVDIQREVFEAAQAAPTESRRGRSSAAAEASANWRAVPSAASNDLFRAERIYATFTARENAVWSVLNAIASSKPFMVLADVRMQNPLGFEGRKAPTAAPASRQAASGRGTAAAAAAAAGKVPDRDERIVAGREAIKVEILVDVYRFAEVPAKEETP
jgi:hypothetical protein